MRNELYTNSVDPLQAELTDINDQMRREQHSNVRRLEDLEKNARGMTAAGLDAEKNRINTESLRRQADLAIIQLSRQGRYDSAKAIADRAVAAEFEKQQLRNETLKFVYEQNKDKFTTAEQRAFETAQSDRERSLENQQYAARSRFDQVIKENDPLYREQLAALQRGEGQIVELADGTKVFYNTKTNTSTPIANGLTGATGADAAVQAIYTFESGGDYNALGKPNSKGQRAYGKYQVMDFNIPSWTKKYYGQSLTPQEYLANPAAQDAVGRGYITEEWNKHGNIRDVATMFFHGKTWAQAEKDGSLDVADANGTTVRQYINRVEGDFNKIQAAAIPKTTVAGETGSTTTFANAAAYQGLTNPQKTRAVALDNLVTELNRYRSLYDSKVGAAGGNIFGSDSAELQSQFNTLMFAMAQAEGTGALQAPDREVLEKAIPNPTSAAGAFNTFTKGGRAGGLKQLDTQIQKYTNQLGTFGLQPTGQQQTVLPNGGLEMTGADANDLIGEDIYDSVLGESYANDPQTYDQAVESGVGNLVRNLFIGL
jgi:hypothetical protein